MLSKVTDCVYSPSGYLTEVKSKSFANGCVYALRADDGYLIETTDTFLPFYTKDAVGRKQNALTQYDVGSRAERWMIGVSVMSGCPVRCKFCATGQMKKWRNLTADEIVAQIVFVLAKNPGVDPKAAREFKINYTRMGEPFLNIEAVKEAIQKIDKMFDKKVHHYVSTIGIKDSDFSFVRDNVTLQLSLHSLDQARRDWLIPFRNKLSVAELGAIRTDSALKTTLNLTLVKDEDFDIETMKKFFEPAKFFVKLSPINTNEVSDDNHLGTGVIKAKNLV